jgi:hypothetical protein
MCHSDHLDFEIDSPEDDVEGKLQQDETPLMVASAGISLWGFLDSEQSTLDLANELRARAGAAIEIPLRSL